MSKAPKAKARKAPTVRLTAAQSALWRTDAPGALARSEALRSRIRARCWSMRAKHGAPVAIVDAWGAHLETCVQRVRVGK